jgi:hypothetical protein
MRNTPLPLLAALSVLACGGAETPPEQAPPRPAAASTPPPPDVPIPAGSRGTPAAPVEHAPLPYSRAARTLPRSPYLLIRSAAELDSTWRQAGGSGAPPKVDFARTAVVALRLPAGAERDAFTPLAHAVGGATQVVLPAATPRHVGALPTDRLEFYAVAITGGPVSRVRYASGE